MKDDIERLKHLHRNLPDEAGKAEEESVAGVFGWLRGIKERATMLELRLKTGDSVALNYSWLDKATYNLSTGITLQFAGAVVLIRGERLNTTMENGRSLYEGLLRQRVTWIQEADQAKLLSNNVTVIVSAIKIAE